jgi:hypothetical protein
MRRIVTRFADIAPPRDARWRDPHVGAALHLRRMPNTLPDEETVGATSRR